MCVGFLSAESAIAASQVITLIDEYIGGERMSDTRYIANLLGGVRDIFSPFQSETVEVRDSLHGGRGFFSSTRIPSGTLLLVEYPSASITDVDLAQSCYSGTDGGDTLALVERICCAWSDDLEKCLRGLHPLRSKCFDAIPNTAGNAELIRKLVKVLPSDMDPLHVIRAVELNSIGFYTFPELVSYDDHLRYLSGTGLYMAGSMFNHSCSPNVMHYAIGDVMFFRSLRDIEPNEELFISYIGSDLLHETKSIRSEFLSGRDFDCNCDKCETPERSDDPWLEELDLATRAELRLLEGQSQLNFIDNLLENHAYVTRDMIKLLFLKCRTARREDGREWDEVVNLIDRSDFTLAVVHSHYGAIFGFTDEAKAIIESIGQRCFGISLGSFDMLFRLLMTTDFR